MDAERPVRRIKLLEVLVIFVIIAAVVAVLLPLINHLRESNRRMACLNKIKPDRPGLPEPRQHLQQFLPACRTDHSHFVGSSDLEGRRL